MTDALITVTRAIIAAALLAAPLAVAQAVPRPQDVLARLEATQKSIKDLRARLVGSASSADTSIRLDLEVRAIPAQDLLRVSFNAPDTLADNFFIVDKQRVSSYLFLTNQLTISPLAKGSVAGFNFDVNQFSDFSSVLPADKVNFRPVVAETTPAGRAYVLDASPKPGVELPFTRARLWVLENGWRPYRLQSFAGGSQPQSDLTVTEWSVNQGLTPASLRAVPRDAEVIRR